MVRTFVLVASAAASVFLAAPALAQSGNGVGVSLTPYGGYMVTGRWYDGPVGTSIGTSNAPMVGVNAGIPLTRGVSLVGTVGYASGDVRIGLPIIGGVNAGSASTWVYDVGLEVGGLAGRNRGVAPFITGGVGAMTTDIENSLFATSATNFVYTGGVGLEVGVTEAVALRVHAKDYIGRFDSREAVGFEVKGNLTHNWALTAGIKLAF